MSLRSGESSSAVAIRPVLTKLSQQMVSEGTFVGDSTDKAITLGHEATGVVQEVGSIAASKFKTGDRVGFLCNSHACCMESNHTKTVDN